MDLAEVKMPDQVENKLPADAQLEIQAFVSENRPEINNNFEGIINEKDQIL